MEDEMIPLHRQPELTEGEKEELFIHCLQKKIQSWYETMIPVPWKKPCRWKSTDLFVGRGLILTDSNAKRRSIYFHDECYLQYKEILNHESLKTEKRIILEGEPGSGKTMMSSQIAYDWSQGNISEMDVLIFLPLKFVNNATLVEAVKTFYFSTQDSISVDDIENFLTNEDLQSCLILDGFEEYNSGVTTSANEPSEVEKIMKNSKYPNSKVILTSRYARDLPRCPMLRIWRLRINEKDVYIKKVFADDIAKQHEIKRVIENNPFISALCDVSLWFVLVVHNIGDMGSFQESQLDRVSPFMENIVRILRSSSESVERRVGLNAKGASEDSQLGELAFNGLCKGRQVLSWRKDMLEKNVDNLKEILDSGILVVEEGFEKGTSRGFHQVAETDDNVEIGRRKKEKKQTGIKYEANKVSSGVVAGLPESSAELNTGSDAEISALAESNSDSTVPEVKFFHKLMQEWYAAKYLSSILRKSSLDNSLNAMMSGILPHINPTDLHYVLRFTSYLFPPCCYIIMEFLLNNYRTEEGAVPEYIMDCICLCFVEYNSITELCLEGVVAKLCGEIITIRPDASRYIQQSKMALMRFASRTGIPIKEVRLVDVVSVGEQSLTFGSGVEFDVFNTIQIIEISQWCQLLVDEDYANIVKLVLGSHSIKIARLLFPSPPPYVDTEMPGDVIIHDKRIEWILGQITSILNLETFSWELALRKTDPTSVGSEQMEEVEVQPTPYGRFLSTLAAHLTASSSVELCRYFNMADEKRSRIMSSPDPGLFLLVALDKDGIISSSDVGLLEQSFRKLKLVQAEAKIHEYQSLIEEERNQLQRQTKLTEAEKEELFIQCLQRRIQSWYETMTPVPWKKSCRWRSTDLFVSIGLVLTDSKAKRSLTNVDKECKLQYNKILNDHRLKTKKRIIIEGEPGSGKTMMSSQLAYDWSQGRLSEVDVLIFLPLKIANNATLVEAVKTFYFPLYDSISVSDIESFLTNEDLKSCLILDGFEEYNSGVTISANEPSEVAKVFEKLKYPNCTVILTSRSDYAKDLPACPMLRIGKLGETERNTYIEKVFADNIEKQQEVKRVIENTPFILDVCSVPLLFVLTVHNIESMGSLQKSMLDGVSPFIENIVRILRSSSVSGRGPIGSNVKGASGKPLEEFAYNGLCKGRQVLSWRKDMLEKNIGNLKELLRSGILVVEEEIEKGSSRDFHHVAETDEDVKMEKRKRGKKQTGTKDDPNKATSGVIADLLESSEKTKSDSDADVRLQTGSSSSPTAKHFAVEVKFLHKVMQEWYAAKYLSSILWKSSFCNSLDAMVSDILPQINPFDLHYVLRFTSYLFPQCCYLIMEFLLNNNRTKEGAVPEHIMNCVCLCFAEYNGIMDHFMEDVVAKVCEEIITIRSDEGRLTQQSKVALIRLASRTGIPVKGVQLLDVVSKVGEQSFTLDSGVEFDVLNMIKMIEMCRWDHHLKEKDYNSIVKLVLSSHSIEKARLHFPIQPPAVNTEGLKDVVIHDKKIEWIVGSKLTEILNLKTYKWEVTFDREDLVSVGSEQVRAAKHEDVDVMTVLHKQQFIDEHGGTLFLFEADVSLHVPARALKDGCVIHVTVPLDPGLFFPDHEIFPRTTPLIICEPDNLRFDKPVTLTIPHCAVLNYSRNHAVEVWFGQKTDNNSTEFTWLPETVEHSLGEHYCTVSLSHFCGVNVIIGSVESKILRLIPYTKIEHSGKQVVTVWLCNDLEPDFKSVMQSEEKNKGLPLDSYDTFQLQCISGSENKVNVRIEVLEGSSWRPEETDAQVISVERLVTSSKTNCTFRLTSDVNDDGKYMYFLLRVTQGGEKKKTETVFAIRKRICDLEMPVNFMRPLSINNQISHLQPTDTEASLQPYTVVVYMDPVNHFKDDVIITVWLWPFDSTTKVFKNLQREQELQYRHQVHTENSFSVVHEQPDVVTKAQLRNGHWVLSPKEMKIETDRIRFGSRAKFQFIGERGESNETASIDLRVETYQVGEDVVRFMAEVELIQLLFETRQKEIDLLNASSASTEYTISSSEVSDHSNKPLKSNQDKFLPSTSSEVVNKQPFQSKQNSDGNIQPRKHTVGTRTPEKRLRRCFMFLKKNLGKDWKDLARYLEAITEDELILLSSQYKDDIGEGIYQMLLSWQRKNGALADPEMLIAALNDIFRKDLADKLAAL